MLKSHASTSIYNDLWDATIGDDSDPNNHGISRPNEPHKRRDE